MKTITYNPETHALVPREPNHNWCAGCSPDNCSGCGAEPVDSEPAMWVMKHIRSGDLAQAKPNQKALHPRMWSQAHLYTTPQPDRVAELEAALKVARDGIDKFLVANDPTEFGCACDLSVGYLCGPCHADKLRAELAEKDEVIAEAGEMLAMRDRQLAALKAENESLRKDAERH